MSRATTFVNDARGEFSWFPGWILGTELIENMKRQACAICAEFRAGACDGSGSEGASVPRHRGRETLETKTVIVAAGASARLLGLERRKRIDWAWSFYLRHLRRIFLPRKTNCRGWGAIPRWRIELSLAVCEQSVPDSPAKRVPWLQRL